MRGTAATTKTSRCRSPSSAPTPSSVFDVWDEFKIDPDELKAWQENRQGCVVDRRLAEQRGWKIGERIPLQGTFYPVQPRPGAVRHVRRAAEHRLAVVPLGVSRRRAAGRRRRRGAGNAGTIFAKVESAGVIPAVVQAIDDQFASSDNPTRTQTEAAFAQMFTDMLGNVQAYIRNIGLAVVFSLSLVAANAMAMSMRERTTEIAVLKAIGFPRAACWGWSWAKSCLIAPAWAGCSAWRMGCLFLRSAAPASARRCSRSRSATWPARGCCGCWPSRPASAWSAASSRPSARPSCRSSTACGESSAEDCIERAEVTILRVRPVRYPPRRSR